MRVEKILYALINPLIRGLLRSPFHRLGSRNLAILCFTGRKSGNSYDTPLSYVRHDQTVLFLSSRQTKWWTNFTAEPSSVEVELENRRYSGQARLFTDGDSGFVEGIRDFISQLPRDAVVYGIKLDGQRKPTEESLKQAAPQMILVEVKLESGPGTTQS